MSALVNPPPSRAVARRDRVRIDAHGVLQGMSGTAHDLGNRLNALIVHLELANNALGAAQTGGLLGENGAALVKLVKDAQRSVRLLGVRNNRLRTRYENAIRRQEGVEVPKAVDRQLRAKGMGDVPRGGAAYAAMLHRQVAALHQRIEAAVRTFDADADLATRHAKVGERLRFIASCSAEMLKAKEDLIALGEGNFEPRPIDLGDVVQRAWRLVGSQVRSTARATVSLTDVRPILGVPSQFLDVVLNVIINAHQALTDSPAKMIRLDIFQEGDRAVLEVRDSGTGLPPGDVARIFEPFFTTKPGGTGQGLANVQRIVTSVGGRIIARAAGPDASPFTTLFRLELPTVVQKPG